MITVYAPGRAELLGNHTDYNEGYVLALAVQRGTTVKGEVRADGVIHLLAKDLDEEWTGNVDAIAPQTQAVWANYVLGVVAQFQKHGVPVPGFTLEITSNLPMGAGLSSSAALEVSTALFLQKITGTTFPRLELAKIAQAAEHAYAGVKCGLLDQIASLFGAEGQVTFIDCRSYEVKNIPVPEGMSFVICNSGMKHALVGGEYNERREDCEAAARALGVPFLRDVSLAQLEAAKAALPGRAYRRALHVVGENTRVLEVVDAWQAGDSTALARAMFASHESSQVNFENSCAELDVQVGAMRQFGVGGARLSGGGFGGATIHCVPTERVEALVTFLEKECPGCKCLVTQAADGARVL